MQFQITQDSNNTWNIKPLSGALEGRTIANVEGINLQGVKFAGKTMIGAIKALWGVTVLVEDMYSDMETLRAMCLGGVFDTSMDEKLVIDFDGYVDVANHVCKGAKKLLAIGNSIMAKGCR